MLHTRVYIHAHSALPVSFFSFLLKSCQLHHAETELSCVNVTSVGRDSWGRRQEKGGWQHGPFQPGQQAYGPETTKINQPTKMKETTTNPKGFAQR